MPHLRNIFLFLVLAAMVGCGGGVRHGEMLRMLERAEGMNSSYTPMDTLLGIEEMTEYFMAHGSEEEKIRANYMMGSVFRDRGDSPKTLEFYLKAVGQADTTSRDCNFELLSRIYAQMALLLEQQNFPQKGVEMWENAKRMAKRADDEQMFAECLSHSFRCFEKLGDKPKAIQILKESQRRLRQLGSNEYAASISGELAAHYLQQDSLAAAKREIDTYLNQSNLFTNGEIHPDCVLFYYYLGQYYEKANQPDSALHFYRKLGQYPSEVENIVHMYEGLLSVYAKTQRTDSVAKYASLYTAANDSANKIRSAEEISRVQSLYDYTAHKQRALEKTEENHALWRIIFLAVVALIAGVSAFWIFQMRQRQKQQSLHQQIARLRQFEKMQKEQSEATATKQDLTRQHLFESESYKLIRQLITENKPLKDSDLAKIDETINQICDGFKSTLYSAYNLSAQEYSICLLLKFELSTKEISGLLCRSRSAITYSRKRLFVKLFGREGSANELDLYIVSL